MRELVTLFGARRATELLGWSLLWGATGVESVADLRADLEARGLKKSAMYRAAADFRRWKEHLETLEGSALTVGQAIQRLREVK